MDLERGLPWWQGHGNPLPVWKIPRTKEPVGYSPWDHKESNLPEATDHSHLHRPKGHTE